MKNQDTIRPESNLQFIKHAPCKHCPSSDAVAVYADGHGHCFSCDWTGTYEAAVKTNGSSITGWTVFTWCMFNKL